MTGSAGGKKLVEVYRRSEAGEFGFGQTTSSAGYRILNKDGSANIVRLGEKSFSIANIYHRLIDMSWPRFMLMVTLLYALVNLAFTLIYFFLIPDGIAGMIYQTEWERFWEVYFFSAQSLTTVGYGRENPVGQLSGAVAAIESFIGLMGFALATGLLYGRFSRPTALFRFSNNMLVAPYKHARFPEAEKGIMFRVMNGRNNQLIEVEALVLFSYNAEQEGKVVRKFDQLKLEVEKISFLAMSWTIVHPIDANSPLYGLTPSELEQLDAEFMISMKAVDDTYVQQVYSRSSYTWKEVIWGARFSKIISNDPNGRIQLHVNKLSEYNLVEES